ncbi:MAG: hypothetical protein JXR84_20475, partial [Anaerolineae bacterium]|nr:hypothetical protein [Anaerolineae bacterium]
AFTADITGLQTFPDYHARGMSLGTHAQWGWHSMPNPAGYRLEDALENYIVKGRTVPYLSGLDASGAYLPASDWLRANPHRLHLGQLGLRITKTDGTSFAIEDITYPRQTLDLWEGLLDSRFEVDGQPVHVRTICHPARDVLAVRIASPLLAEGRLAVTLAFPYGAAEWGNAVDWTQPERHRTQAVIAGHRAEFTRTLDADGYHVRLVCSRAGRVQAITEQEYEITSPGSDVLELVLGFSPEPCTDPLPDFDATREVTARHWAAFWESGAAIDFSACTDPRAGELERRLVLSQYLTAIHCAGSMPPQETGLVCNSWFGKPHLEMHWWHAVHFALWDRLPLLERSLPWYERVLPQAQATAARQGYRGARWQKMVGPDGQDSPSDVGVFLIWQQPHPIYYAELCYRAHPNRETLDLYQQIVFETAEFMASYPIWEEAGQRYVLGPVMIPAQESYGRNREYTLNPTFELAYWYWALDVAQRWRERLGMNRHPQWERVLRYLARPTVRDGVYTAIETPPYTISNDHPSMLAALGVLPATPLIDPAVMGRTFDAVLRTWDWPTTWGWDYPLLAMTAARLGRPEQAVDALFLDSPKNRYLPNGHNYQAARLPLYLPGNGGLLTVVAMMAAGWDGMHDRPMPGFPDNGAWTVHYEGLQRMP